MSRWPAAKARRVIAALVRIGWIVKRQASSHRTLARPSWPDFVFSFHDDDEIGPRMLARSLPALVDALLSATPGSAAAEQPQRAIESLLMGALRSGGRSAGEGLVDSLTEHGHVLERLDALPSMWRVALPPPRVLEIWFTGGDHPVLAALSYRIGKPWGSKQQRSAAKLQAAFYERYGQLAAQGGAQGPDDRLIQLVGELEADINNGGFDQYLRNKGEERGREALASLSVIGARRTARWLAAALEAGTGGDGLERLDEQFNAKPEDLASLVMTYIKRKK